MTDGRPPSVRLSSPAGATELRWVGGAVSFPCDLSPRGEAVAGSFVFCIRPGLEYVFLKALPLNL